jgi:phytoene/squalene synthetase
VGYGLSRLFHAGGTEDLASDSLSNSMGLFLQKINIIRDYLEDINEIPKSRMFWPREIWSKYVNKLEVYCPCIFFFLTEYYLRPKILVVLGYLACTKV